MSPIKCKNKKKQKRGGTNDAIDITAKRSCVRSANSTLSVKQETDLEPEQDDGNGSSNANTNIDDTNPRAHQPDVNGDVVDVLPTPVELSKVLCRIVDTDTYSRQKAVDTLEQLLRWLEKCDTKFLTSFYALGGVIKVLHYITERMDDVHCRWKNRMEGIHRAALVLAHASCLGGDEETNQEIVTNIVTCAVYNGGLEISMNVSGEYTGGEDDSGPPPPPPVAVSAVWCVVRNIFSSSSLNIEEEKAVAVFGTGMDLLTKLKYVDESGTSVLLEHIFITLRLIVHRNCITKPFIQQNTIISKCLDVFKKKNGSWNDDRGEEATKWATELFCDLHDQNLLTCDSDYELLLPFYVFAFEKQLSNDCIHDNSIDFFGKSCSVICDTNIIKRSKVLESLGRILSASEVSEDKRKEVGILIGKIAAAV